MSSIKPTEALICVEDVLWVLDAETWIPAYDFRFDQFFSCRHPEDRPAEITAVARVGALEDYATRHAELLADGIRLVNSPEEHLQASQLPFWYPLLEDLTPKSIWFEQPPEPVEVESHFDWPIFVKGARQSSRHRRALSIILDAESFRAAMQAFRADSILHWQQIVCREFIPLRSVEDLIPDRVPSSFEFRTFWWKGEFVGIGPYWWQGKPYSITEAERAAAVKVAEEAAGRLSIPFLVIDMAQTMDGRWIVIECNDAQESGYTGVSSIGMWQKIVDMERSRQAS
jgi:hypothetical protein